MTPPPDDNEPPPVLGSWRRVYAVVIGALLAQVALYWWLGRVYG